MDITKFYADPNEKPLDRIKPDGGFTGIFRTMAFIGDSLSSGEFESTNAEGGNGYHDMFEYSWGQYIARAAGLKAYNFSRGGMTAKEYLESWGEANGVWDPAKASQAYVLALGVNDLFGLGQELGSVGDVDPENYKNNKPTFAGMYAEIIQRYKEIQPKGRFFLMTMPRSTIKYAESPTDMKKLGHAKLLHDLAGLFDFTYVIDLWQYGPVYDAEFAYNFFLGGHMNPAGYLLTAQMTMSYIDWIIRNNPEDFAQVGFIGTEFHNAHRKW